MATPSSECGEKSPFCDYVTSQMLQHGKRWPVVVHQPEPFTSTGGVKVSESVHQWDKGQDRCFIGEADDGSAIAVSFDGHGRLNTLVDWIAQLSPRSGKGSLRILP